MFRKRQQPYILITFVWSFVALLAYHKFGIVTIGEAPKYIGEATNLLQGKNLSSSNFRFYFLEIALIFLSLKFTGGYLAVIILQLVANLMATFTLYETGKYLLNPLAGIVASIAFLLSPMQNFNFFLQTDSLFYSAVIIICGALLQWKGLTVSKLVFLLSGIVLLCITRPSGIIFLPPVIGYILVLSISKQKPWIRIVLLSALLGISLYVLNTALGSGGELDFAKPYQKKCIICGVATVTEDVPLRQSTNPNSVAGLFYLLSHNFSLVLELSGKRAWSFFSLTRGYFSWEHNLYLLLTTIPLYIGALFCFSFWKHKHPAQLLFILLVLMCNLATVMLTCDDWHNRFFFTIVPFLILLALPALCSVIRKVQKLFSNKI